MKRTSLERDRCPIARTLNLVGDWWSLLIIRDAFTGVSRFGDFQKHLGVAKNILSTRLKYLVEHEILQLRYEVGGGHGEYILTTKGAALLPVLVTLAQWGEANTAWPADATQVVDSLNFKPLRPVQLVAQDGRILQSHEIATTIVAASDAPV